MLRLKLLITTFLICLISSATAQFFEDFSDGDLHENPKWTGDTAQFVINGQQQLQLNAPEAGNVYIAVKDTFWNASVEWRLSVKMSFAPSANNFARYYLSANDTNLRSDSLLAYYLQLGEAGNNDVIELICKSSDSTYRICRGNISIASSFAYNIKVVKDDGDRWTIFVDTLCNGIYTEDASGYGNDLAIAHTSTGIVCQFTAGNKNKFYFDDIYFGPPIVDTVPPQISNCIFNSNIPDKLILTFSEPILAEDALDFANYTLHNDTIHPALCEFAEGERSVVHLYFSEPLIERYSNELHISNIHDISNNVMTDTILSVFFCIPRRNEVIITEIMADPSPTVGLPECEYLEIHNKLPYSLLLDNWKIAFGNSQRTLPSINIPPNGFALITAESSLPYFTEYQNIYSVSSLGLTDDGQQLTLYDTQGEVIHFVNYSKKWHRNTLKQEGGWALEMIDAENPCCNGDNWDSSIDIRGGTPGATNSIADEFPDLSPPEIEKVTVPEASRVRVFFTEPLTADATSFLNIFSIDRNIQITDFQIKAPDFQIAELTLAEALTPNVIYTLTANPGICDCVGNSTESEQSFIFGLPEAPTAGDIIINEVLSNPFGETDADFIEVYNRSDKLIDLGHLYVGTGNGSTADNVVRLVPSGYQLFPYQLAAICKNRATTIEQYASAISTALVENDVLPALPNDGATIHILDLQYNKIEQFCYDKTMHFAMLTSTDGVSLERIHYAGLTQDASNWTSAAEGVGWATPGAVNSHATETAAATETVEVIPDIISPDGDGFNDFAEIHCHFEESEIRATIDIYNSQGQRIRQITGNQVCGLDEHFRWDGLTDDNRDALNDIYIAVIQLWNTQGKHKIFRRPIAVVRKE